MTPLTDKLKEIRGRLERMDPAGTLERREFIAAAPSDIAFLLATVERMTAALQFYATTSEVNDITLRFGWRARAALGESE